MGVKYLGQWCQDRNIGYFVHSPSAGRGTKRVVIDGHNITSQMSYYLMQDEFEEATCRTNIRKLLDGLKMYLDKHHIQVVAFCFDGMFDDDKMSETLSRAVTSLNDSKKVWRNGLDCGACFPLPFFMYTLDEWLKEKGIPIRYTGSDPDL